MREIGIDISQQRGESAETFGATGPSLPAAARGSREERLRRFRDVRDGPRERIRTLTKA